tara:strand:- start:252 stop:500 length:249 start_codon:yes stop_codon:yes gene_type:complete
MNITGEDYDEELYAFIKKYFDGCVSETEFTASAIELELDRYDCITDDFFKKINQAYSNMNELDDIRFTINMDTQKLVIYYAD